MQNTFKSDLAFGKQGEVFCYNYILQHNPSIQKEWLFDVSENKLLQMFDIDLVLAKNENAYKRVNEILHNPQQVDYIYNAFFYDIFQREDVIPIEVKVDTRTRGLRKTNNILFEIVSHNTAGTYATRAKYVYYICLKQQSETSPEYNISEIFFVEMKKLREYHRNLIRKGLIPKQEIYDKNVDILFNVDLLLKENIVKSISKQYIENAPIFTTAT